MSSKQSDKLKKLLGMKERKVPDAVRLREMNDVRNYNRNQQARVFENEKRQVARYADTNAPESAKDIGSSFKLQVYTLKLQSIVQAKLDAIGQVELVIGTSRRGNPDLPQQEGQPPAIVLGASQLRDARLAPYVNTIFGKAELVNAFNEMMSFIKTYMGDLFSDDRLRDSVYASLLTPLSQQLVQCANQYPEFYQFLQVRGDDTGQRGFDQLGEAGKNDYRAKAIFRQQAVQVFSLLMACAENINIQSLRPITARDVDQYAKDNDVDQIIRTRGRAVGPLAEGVLPTPALPAGQPILPLRPDEPPPPEPSPAYPPSGPTQPIPQQPQQQQGQAPVATVDSTKQLMLAFEADGNSLRRSDYQPTNGTGLRRALLAWNDQQQNPFPVPRTVDIESARVEIARERRQGGQPAPQPAPASPQQQGQQGQQAVDIRLQQQLSPQGQDITDGDNVRQALRAEGTDIPDNYRDVADRLVSRIKGAEQVRQGIYRYRNEADVNEIWNSLANSSLGVALDALMADEGGQKMLIRDIMRGMMLVRKARADQLAGQQDSGRQNELWGMGKKTNAKVFLRGCGVPEDIIGTAMMRHGLPDDAEVGDLEGSGIMDTLKDFAGSVADSASGWFNTIKANMPTMSDVRRAVAKVVPDSLSEYVPSGLKRTFGDKAKDFFGFGMSGGEFQADPHRPTHARHREPFDNFFDNRGYRQGAVQRMTTMFVPDWELSSGLHNLKGGDQLRDHDPEVLRRQDHHDISLYRPVVQQQPIHGYGHDGDEDEQFEGGLKQRLSRRIEPAVVARPYRKDPMLVHRVEDHDEFQPRVLGDEGLSHYEELEKPADMDEDPNPFRVRTENHKVNTGKMKKVTYHTK